MTRNISTTRRIVTSTLAALVLAMASSQAGLAQGNSAAGIWKVDPTNSKFSSGVATLILERNRNGAVNPAAGSFIVVSKGNVYLVTGTAASGNSGGKPVDYTVIKDRQAVMIGTNARSAEHCGSKCTQGLPDSRMTLTFKTVDAAKNRINDMLVYDTGNK